MKKTRSVREMESESSESVKVSGEMLIEY